MCYNCIKRQFGLSCAIIPAGLVSTAYVNSLNIDYKDAERLLVQALKLRRWKLGEDHPVTLESKNDIAVLYREQARYDEAEELLLRAIEGRRLKLGDPHPHQ